MILPSNIGGWIGLGIGVSIWVIVFFFVGLIVFTDEDLFPRKKKTKKN